MTLGVGGASVSRSATITTGYSSPLALCTVTTSTLCPTASADQRIPFLAAARLLVLEKTDERAQCCRSRPLVLTRRVEDLPEIGNDLGPRRASQECGQRPRPGEQGLNDRGRRLDAPEAVQTLEERKDRT